MMWPSSLLPAVLYPPPASAFVTAMSVVSFVSLASAGVSELRGDHMAYSKFWHVVSGQQKRSAAAAGALLSSRLGMLVAYVPALVAAAVSFAVPGAVEGLRPQILSAALAVHFLKRVLEVMIVEQYSPSGTSTTKLNRPLDR
jgi:very-long-chain enoyl-CoA reductase